MIWGNTSNYTGSSSDLRREQRMSEFQRAMMLPALQRETAQARMIADPNDREAVTRLERINQRHAAASPDRRAQEVAALQEYNATPATLRGIPTQRSTSYSDANQRLSHGSAGGGGVFTTGEVNGNEVVVPTAGNYNAYRSTLAQLGLGDSPTPGAFDFAMQRARLDPNTIYKAQSDERIASMRADAVRDTQRQKSLSQQQTLAAKNKAASDKASAAEQKSFNTDFSKANTQLNQIRNKDGYGFYVKNWQTQQKDFAKNRTPFADQVAALDAQGVPYTLVDAKEKGRAAKRPVMVNRGDFDPYRYDPTRWDNEVAQTNALRQTRGGSAAVDQFMQQKYPLESQWASATQRALAETPASPEAHMQEAASAVGRAFQQRIASGMSPEQATQEILSLTQRDPEKHRQAQQVLHRAGYLQNPNDRILATQVGR